VNGTCIASLESDQATTLIFALIKKLMPKKEFGVVYMSSAGILKMHNLARDDELYASLMRPGYSFSCVAFWCNLSTHLFARPVRPVDAAIVARASGDCRIMFAALRQMNGAIADWSAVQNRSSYLNY